MAFDPKTPPSGVFKTKFYNQRIEKNFLYPMITKLSFKDATRWRERVKGHFGGFLAKMAFDPKTPPSGVFKTKFYNQRIEKNFLYPMIIKLSF